MTQSPPSERWLALYRSMPTSRAGSVIAIQYAPPDQVRELARRWEEWAEEHDIRDWDPWLKAHMDAKVKSMPPKKLPPPPPPEPVYDEDF
jgi:hypothetical protein